MKISLVTPCFNAAAYIGETLDSVLAQNWPDIEYFVADGGSTDGTTAQIEQRADRLAWWVSEKDGGQVQALNKGFARATGDILGFINADDVLRSGALQAVAQTFAAHPEADIVVGEVEWIDAAGESEGIHAGNIASLSEILAIYDVWWGGRQWVQPEVFFRRSLRERVGLFNERYQLAFDFEFWVRCLRAGARVVKVPQVLARFRRHAEQKSSAAGQAADEIRAVVREALAANPPIPRWRRLQLGAQLSYDEYQLGRSSSDGRRPSLLNALLRHPEWILSPAARTRIRAACARLLSFTPPG
jgi:glycosyltransferase involved in cell wall biosynthesis